MGNVFGYGYGALSVDRHVFGVTWTRTEGTALTRINYSKNFADPIPYINGATEYSSPFDNFMPWKGMVKVTDSAAGELVAIPKFWYKLTKKVSAITIQIADYPAPGFAVSPAHMDRGDGAGERDIIYVSRYHCSNNNYKSTTGVTPKANITRSSARIGIHYLGSSIWQLDYATHFTIGLLYVVEFANWDVQAMIGYGDRNGSILSTGTTDNMPYHTGTIQNSKTTYGAGVQYRYIEDLWANIHYYLDGAYGTTSNSIAQTNFILNPNQFSDTSNGIAAGLGPSGYPTEFAVVTSPFPFLQVISASDTDSSLFPDKIRQIDASSPVMVAGGGDATSSLSPGLFNIGTLASNSYYSNIGCRLMKLP